MKTNQDQNHCITSLQEVNWVKNYEDIRNVDRLLSIRLNKDEKERKEKEWLNYPNQDLRSLVNIRITKGPVNGVVKNKRLTWYIATAIIFIVIGLAVICIPAHAAFSPEGVNQWANVVSNMRSNPSADYQRQRAQQMQEEHHQLQMELLQEQINQMKKQKQRR